MLPWLCVWTLNAIWIIVFCSAQLENSLTRQCFFPPTALLVVLCVRRVPEEQKLCKLLLKSARRVGQVIQRPAEHQLHWQRYATNSVTAHNNKKQNNGIWLWTGMHKPPRQTLCQICSSGSFQIHWGQENCNLCPENHYCPVRTLPSRRICVLWQKKVFHMFCNKDFCSLRVLMWVPFSVPVMHSVQRAVWPPASAWRLSSVKQGTLVNLLLSLLLC